MRKFLVLALLIASLTACTTRTPEGPCVGVLTKQDPALEYELSGWNIAVGIILSETLIIPAVVVLDNLYCPVGKKGTP